MNAITTFAPGTVPLLVTTTLTDTPAASSAVVAAVGGFPLHFIVKVV